MAQWRKVTMKEAIRFIRDGDGQPLDRIPEYAAHNRPPHCEDETAVEWFDNGTAVACEPGWVGPYSEITPDPCERPPNWWIYC